MIRRRFSLVWGFCLIFLTACVPVSHSVATEEIALAYTAAAETVLARFTLQAGEQAVAELTRQAGLAQITPTAVVLLPSSTPLPEQSPTTLPQPTLPPATPTPLSPTATPAPIPTLPCEAAEFLQEINVPAGTYLIVGGRFSKIWQVRNVGTCAWTTAYSLAFAGGHQLGSAATVFLPATVPPGATVNLSVPMVAPAASGFYQSFWTLRNAAGVSFNIIGTESGFLESTLRAVQPVGWGTASLDFTADLCAAEWRSSSQDSLPCPGSSNHAAGSVIWTDRPGLENGRTAEYGLWTRTPQGSRGWLAGQYPPYLVRANDHFLAELACLANSRDCEVLFELRYRLPDGSTALLGQWQERLDGATTPVDLDLSPLAGRSIQFLLVVNQRGGAGGGNAFWVRPRIQTLTPAGRLVLTWRRQNPGQSGCDELRLYLLSPSSAEAQAWTCSGENRLRSRTPLSPEQMNQLLAWIRALSTFEGEIYQATTDQPVLVQLSFIGNGSAPAQDSDIQALSNFAQALFTQLTR